MRHHPGVPALHPVLRFALPLWLIALAACAAPAGDGLSGAAADARRAALTRAMAQRDLAAIGREVEAANRALGDHVGVPETPDRHTPVPRNATPLSADEARRAVAPALARMATLRWWADDTDPRTLGHPLREAAEVATGALAMGEADPASAGAALAQAVAAGEFLLRAQAEAGTGGFPFPASRGVSDAAPFRAAERFMARAERDGTLAEVVRNGWLVRDLGDGGLQFDNGECGVAMLALHAATGEAKYLDAARRAADWAVAQPLAANWNYNSFSVYLLAETWRVTGEARYREAALEKARYGVIPGQLRAGPRAGRWHDPHNARPAYHYIMLRALATLAGTLPDDDDARAEIEDALRLGLQARNPDFTGAGASNKDHALQALCIVARVYGNAEQVLPGLVQRSQARTKFVLALAESITCVIDSRAAHPCAAAALNFSALPYRKRPMFLEETGSREALDALHRLAAAQWRAGRAPLGPRAFGQLLADAATR
jgi:hypothetical protein